MIDTTPRLWPATSPPIPDDALRTLAIPFPIFERTLRGIAVASKASPTDTQLLLTHARQLSARTSQLRPDTDTELEAISLAHIASPNNTPTDLSPLLTLAFALSALRVANTHVTGLPHWTSYLWSLISSALVTTSTLSSSSSSSPSTLGHNKSRFSFSPMRSAQGFVAIPLCSLVSDSGDLQELFRVHVWLPDGQRGREELSVHAHQCFARSWILCGRGLDLGFVVGEVGQEQRKGEGAEEGDEGEVEGEGEVYAEYALKWDGGDGKGAGKGYKTHQKSSTVVNTGRYRRVREGERRRHERGMSYSVPAGEFHRTFVDKEALHATLFFFDAASGFEREAPVLGPKAGTEFTHVREDPEIGVEGLVKLVEVVRRLEEGLQKGSKQPDSYGCGKLPSNGVVANVSELMVSEN